MRTKVYLSGKMGDCLVGDVLRERNHAKKLCQEYGLDCIDPADSEGLEKLPADKIISTHLDQAQMHGFVQRDHGRLDDCDVMLVLTGDHPSDGTWWEMARMYYLKCRPVVMVAPQRKRGDLMGFTNILVPRVFETIEGAIVYIAGAHGRYFSNAVLTWGEK